MASGRTTSTAAKFIFARRQEAARREREAWVYLSFTAMLIFVIVVALLWWTW